MDILKLIQHTRRLGIGINMKHFKAFYYAYLIVFLLLIGCHDSYSEVSFIKVESERTKLINGIESYQSIEEFKSFLSRSSFQWEDKEGQPSPKGRPPFNMYTVTIKNYSHMGFPGQLEIIFFNDRLAITTFYPLEIEKYVETLVKAEVIKLDTNREAKIYPYTHVWVARQRKFVGWSDIRLDKEINLWIRRYS